MVTSTSERNLKALGSPAGTGDGQVSQQFRVLRSGLPWQPRLFCFVPVPSSARPLAAKSCPRLQVFVEHRLQFWEGQRHIVFQELPRCLFREGRENRSLWD